MKLWCKNNQNRVWMQVARMVLLSRSNAQRKRLLVKNARSHRVGVRFLARVKACLDRITPKSAPRLRKSCCPLRVALKDTLSSVLRNRAVVESASSSATFAVSPFVREYSWGAKVQ